MKSKTGWILAGSALAMLLSACGATPEHQNPTTDEALNAGPQEQYPEFTLEAQKAAMQRIEEVRRKSRVDGLRAKTPPADWIEIAYHGLVLDANLDVIEMDSETVSKMQQSLFSVLREPTRDKAVRRFGADPGVLFSAQGLQSEERLVVRTAVLNALLAESSPELKARYAWRHRLIRRDADAQINWREFRMRPQVLRKLREYRLQEDWYMPSSTKLGDEDDPVVPDDPAPGSQYIASCRAEGVPIPPDWPDARWISQGPLAFVFISRSYTAEVHAYKDPAVPGVCYALPRRDSSGSIQLLGIICQSDTTGKACFWDNRTIDDTPLTGVNLTLNIDSIGNGSTLGEICTECHRGYNVFNIHPGTALDLSRPTAVGGPYDTDPAVRFTPIAQGHWSNPGPLVLPAPSPGQRSCTACHELPETAGSSYCASVLENAARFTMPPFGPDRAGWPPDPVNPRYADHVGGLSGCP